MSSERGGRQTGIPIGEAAEALGLNVDAVRKRIKRGTLDPYKEADRWYVVLPTVQPAPSSPPGRTAGSPVHPGVQDTGQPIEAAYRVTPAEVEQAIERTGARYVADFAALYDRIAAEVGELYAAQIAAKDQTIATQADALAELRRRAEVAERERDELRSQAVSQPPSAAPPDSTGVGASMPEQSAQGFWQRVRRILGGE